MGRGMRRNRAVINESNRGLANAYRTVWDCAVDLDSEFGML